MTEIITQIPGYENGSVKRIGASEFSAPIIVAEIAIALRDEWNTKVLCLSLDERKGLRVLHNEQRYPRQCHRDHRY